MHVNFFFFFTPASLISACDSMYTCLGVGTTELNGINFWVNMPWPGYQLGILIRKTFLQEFFAQAVWIVWEQGPRVAVSTGKFSSSACSTKMHGQMCKNTTIRRWALMYLPSASVGDCTEALPDGLCSRSYFLNVTVNLLVEVYDTMHRAAWTSELML